MGESGYAAVTHTIMFVIGEKEAEQSAGDALEEEKLSDELDETLKFEETAATKDKALPFVFEKWRPPKPEKVVVNRERKVEPLAAFVYDISPSGNLTIVFNKPIIVPKIVINNENRTISFGLRQLTTEEP